MENEVEKIPVFIRDVDAVRREARSLTRNFIEKNPTHNPCGAARREVRVNLESLVGEINHGYQAELTVMGLHAMECNCEVEINETEKTNVSELAPGVWTLIRDKFNEQNNYLDFHFEEPRLENYSSKIPLSNS